MGNKQTKRNETHPDESSTKRKKKKEKKQRKVVITGQTFGADKVFRKKVKKKLKRKIGKKKKRHPMVFCPITSRVGSDVEAAMGQVENAKGIILVLMHHTRDANYSTAGKNWSETIANVDLDVNVLFHESVPGLLKCSQNDKAVDQVVQFLKQKRKKKTK